MGSVTCYKTIIQPHNTDTASPDGIKYKKKKLLGPPLNIISLIKNVQNKAAAARKVYRYFAAGIIFV